MRRWNCATATRSATVAKGVKKAVGHVNKEIADALIGMDALDQGAIDRP